MSGGKRAAVIALLLIAAVAIGTVIAYSVLSASGESPDKGIRGASEEAGFAVKFDSAGGSFIAPAEVAEGCAVPDPGEPARPGYAFTGWHKDASATVKWDFSKVIAENMTLYAGWAVVKGADAPSPYAVKFDTHGGSAIPSISDIEYGARISEPPAPSNGGIPFKGWFKDPACTVEWSFSADRVTGDITLHAKWAQEVTVTFEYDGADGGSMDARKVATVGVPFAYPAPTRTGFAFGGWYDKANGTNDVLPGTDGWEASATTWTHAGNITLYALWVGAQGLDCNLIGSDECEITGIGSASGSGDLSIPSYIQGRAVVKIGDNAFYDNHVFSGRLFLPSTLKSIGGTAFEGQGFTGPLELPAGLERIEGYAFNGCSGFTGSLVLPEGLTYIGEEAFMGCTGFDSLALPSTLTGLGPSAFDGCNGFRGALVLPDGLTHIPDYAFMNCAGFDSLTLPSNLEQIHSDAFNGCSGFAGDLVIPAGTLRVDSYAFSGCSGFDGRLELPSTLVSIGEETFSGCSGLTDVRVPDTVQNIGDYAFDLCSGIEIHAPVSGQPGGWSDDWAGGMDGNVVWDC